MCNRSALVAFQLLNESHFGQTRLSKGTDYLPPSSRPTCCTDPRLAVASSSIFYYSYAYLPHVMCSYDSFDTFFKEKNDDSFDAPRVGSNAQKHPLLHDTASSDDQLPSKRFCRKGTRVVCKARGLSKKHNASTAYFDIPGNASHGLLLTCSHPECVASGRKFRFCQGKLLKELTVCRARVVN